MKGVFAWMLAACLAVFGLGIGIFFYSLSETWTEANTSAIITAASMVCGGGALLVAVFLAMIVGIPLARRLNVGDGYPPIDVQAVRGGRRNAPQLPLYEQQGMLPGPQYGQQDYYANQQGGNWQQPGPVGNWQQPGQFANGAPNGYGQFDTSRTNYDYWQE